MSCRVNCDAVEAAHVNDQMSIFSSETKRGIAVASTLWSHSDSACSPARHSILNIFDSCWYSVGSRCKRQAKVERLHRLGVVGGILGVDRDLVGRETVIKRSSFVHRECTCRRKKRGSSQQPRVVNFHLEGLEDVNGCAELLVLPTPFQDLSVSCKPQKKTYDEISYATLTR